MTNGVTKYHARHTETVYDRELYNSDPEQRDKMIKHMLASKLAELIVDENDIITEPYDKALEVPTIEHRMELLVITPERLSRLLEIERWQNDQTGGNLCR